MRQTHTHIHTATYTHTHTYTPTPTYTHTQMHTHIHTHTHTHLYKFSELIGTNATIELLGTIEFIIRADWDSSACYLHYASFGPILCIIFVQTGRFGTFLHKIHTIAINDITFFVMGRSLINMGGASYTTLFLTIIIIDIYTLYTSVFQPVCRCVATRMRN